MICLTTSVLVQEAKTLVDILLNKKFGVTTKSVESLPRTMQSDSSSCGALVCFYAKQLSNCD